MDELTTYQPPKIAIHFRDGGYHIVSEETAHKIDDIWSKDKTAKLRFGNVTRITGDIKKIEPVKRDGFAEKSRSNLLRIQKYVIDSTNSDTTKKQIWINHIKENMNRLENGEKWQFADKDCKPCSKEEARKSIFGDDLYSEALKAFGS